MCCDKYRVIEIKLLHFIGKNDNINKNFNVYFFKLLLTILKQNLFNCKPKPVVYVRNEECCIMYANL